MGKRRGFSGIPAGIGCRFSLWPGRRGPQMAAGMGPEVSAERCRKFIFCPRLWRQAPEGENGPFGQEIRVGKAGALREKGIGRSPGGSARRHGGSTRTAGGATLKPGRPTRRSEGPPTVRGPPPGAIPEPPGGLAAAPLRNGGHPRGFRGLHRRLKMPPR